MEINIYTPDTYFFSDVFSKPEGFDAALLPILGWG